MRFVLCSFLLLAPVGVASAADDTSIDALIVKVTEARTALDAAKKAAAKAVADATKAEAAAEADLKAALDALQKKLNDLGLNVPTPTPAPNPPANPLSARIWTAYRADPGDPAKKAATLADLVELMHQSQASADDQTLTTVGALAGKIGAAAKVLAKDQLVGVWAIVKSEIQAAMPTDGPLTADARALAKATFARLEVSLGEAGK